MTHTTITMTIHTYVDPACRFFMGERAPWGMRWMFRCDECRRAAKHDHTVEGTER